MQHLIVQISNPTRLVLAAFKAAASQYTYFSTQLRASGIWYTTFNAVEILLKTTTLKRALLPLTKWRWKNHTHLLPSFVKKEWFKSCIGLE